tara:strand:+ start:1989 stop:3347 length:1359 start_codon:yes stop_codon:yes gene_type:complete
MNLPLLLRLGSSELISIVGAGGKTTLMFRLAEQLVDAGHKVITTTTTRIFAAQTKLAKNHIVLGQHTDDIVRLFSMLDYIPNILVTGLVSQDSDKAYGLEPQIINDLYRIGKLSKCTIIVEADGSRMRPFKAPDNHEPVIPTDTTMVISVVGSDIFGKKLNEINVHRPQIVSRIANVDTESKVTPEIVSDVFLSPIGGMKMVPDKSRWLPFINKVKTSDDNTFAINTANLLMEGGANEVLIGSLLDSTKSFMRFSKVASIVLAAGGSTRMDPNLGIKQLLPWGDDTLVGHSVKVSMKSKVNTIKVVVGNRHKEVVSSLRHVGVETVKNENWSIGQSESLKIGLKSLDDDIGAVIFLLADQPFVDSDLINALILKYYETAALIVAPKVNGKQANPVLFDRDIWSELLMIKGDIGGRNVVDKYKGCVEWIEWDDSIVYEINDMTDYRKILEELD